METEILSYWREHRNLFPYIPAQSRFNRRRRNLMQVFNLVRCIVLEVLDVAQDPQCAIDSLPILAVQFHLAPGASSEWKVHSADHGRVASKKLTIFGYKLHLLVPLGGVILDFTLAPASAHDLKVGEEMLDKHTDMDVLGHQCRAVGALVA